MWSATGHQGRGTWEGNRSYSFLFQAPTAIVGGTWPLPNHCWEVFDKSGTLAGECVQELLGLFKELKPLNSSQNLNIQTKGKKGNGRKRIDISLYPQSALVSVTKHVIFLSYANSLQTTSLPNSSASEL